MTLNLRPSGYELDEHPLRSNLLAIALRVPPNFHNQINVIYPSSLIEKIYFFARDPNHPYKSRHPVPLEGRWPSSRTLGRVAVDAAASGAWSCSQGGPWSVSEHSVQTTGEAAYGKAVWFWHPLLVSSRRRRRRPNRVSTILQSAGDGGKRNSSPGRARYKPSNHCAGNAGVLQLYLYARVRFFALIAHETAGAASTRHSLRPLLHWANDFANLGRMAPRERGRTFSCHHPRRRVTQYSRDVNGLNRQAAAYWIPRLRGV